MSNFGTTYDDVRRNLTISQKVGQLFMPAVFINDSEEEVEKMEQLIQDSYIGALCFFHSCASAATNFEGKKKIIYNEKSLERLKQLIARYQKAAKIPLLIAIDAEWGLAMRIEETPQYPYAITLGALQDGEDLVHQVGSHIGLDCREAGIHWNLAPVVDINNNPDNPVIGYRSFGDDSAKVLTYAQAFLNGMRNSGILNSLKHFPGHGDTATDSHLGLPVIDKSLDELLDNELIPFQKLIQSGVDSVMVGHMSLPQLDSENPSTTSSVVLTEVLRNTLGFDGLIISDALNMHAVSKIFPEQGGLELAAFNAGMDMFCFSEHPKAGIERIASVANKKRIEESFERVWKLKEKALLQDSSGTITNLLDHSILNAKIAENAITERYGNPNAINPLKFGLFANLAVENTCTNQFSEQIEKQFGAPKHELGSDLETGEEYWSQFENIVLALFPPAAKPKSNFGFSDKILALLKRIIQEKNTIIYLFGNPYVLNILGLNPNDNVVVVYQDFLEFQEMAFKHFRGELVAKGELPITLKKSNE